MAGSPTAPVVVLVTSIGEYQLQLIEGMTQALQPHGVPLLAVAVETFEAATTPTVVLDLVRRGATRGVITVADAATFRHPDLEAAIAESGTPLVTLAVRAGPAPLVHGDNVAGMRALMRHLLRERHTRRPVLVRGRPDLEESQVRERVFREECLAHDVAVEEDLVVEGLFRSMPAYNAIHDLLLRRRDFDAVVALNDPSAFGALSALTDAGVRVPEDVLLAGFDNTRDSSLSWPALTTVDQRLEEQGHRAATLLLQLAAGQPCPSDVQLASRLVTRTSTLAVAPSVDDVAEPARLLQSRATLHELAVQVSCAMANCRTLDDVGTVLTRWLPQLGIARLFLGLDHRTPGLRDGPVTNPTRLAFHLRDGRLQPTTGEVFPRHELLPASLRGELRSAPLLLQPLSVEGRDRGYVLFDLDARARVLIEALRLELPRTVDMIFSSQELRDRAAMLERLVSQRTRELAQVNQRLQLTVGRDHLTGIANRRAFEELLGRSRRAGPERDRSLALLMIDIDMFKAFNDRYGHQAGDEALRTVASCLDRAVRPPGLACRYGGEEFAAVLPGCDVAGARAVAARFTELLAEAAIAHAASPVAPVVTASIGVAAAVLTPHTDVVDLVAAADRALYEAKGLGRDRAVVAQGRLPRQGGTPSTQRGTHPSAAVRAPRT